MLAAHRDLIVVSGTVGTRDRDHRRRLGVMRWRAAGDNAAVAGRERVIASVCLLGNVCAVTRDGTRVELPSASQRRLLSILALHAPRRLRGEWLADVLDVSPGALRTSVSRLRAIVGAAALQTSSTGYSLTTDVDAARFCAAVGNAAGARDAVAALEQALTIWTGPALEEFRGEAWADGEIARLTELHAGTVDDYADALVDARRSADAIAVLERQIALYPYRDRSRGLIVRALAGAGRRAEALRAFQQYRSLLIDELGTEPSPEVVRIERRVATGWDGIDIEPDAAMVASHGRVAVPLPAGLAQPGGFVGRRAELDVLVDDLERARTAGLRSVVIEGEPGIGKTSLLAAFAHRQKAAGSSTVVYARCDETGVPLQPFRSMLATCVEHAPSRLLNEHVARCGGDLARICPMIASRVATAPAPTSSDDATERFLAFESAADLLRRFATAERPLVLMLDDVQWAEPTALLLLGHIRRALADCPVLLMVSVRLPGEHARAELRNALADLERGPNRRVQLSGLEDGELVDLVAAVAPGAAADEQRRAAVALRTETAGNPLYASQLARHWLDTDQLGRDGAPDGDDKSVDVPPSLRDVVWSRVGALGRDAVTVLTAASVLGVEFRDDVVTAMVGLSEPVVARALDDAARAGLLVDAGAPQPAQRFVHALVANALYEDLGRSRRVRWHGHAARALERHAGDLRPDVVVQLVRHCARAGWLAEAQMWSTRAGDHALDHLAPAEAAQHYRVALDMAGARHRSGAERADLLVRLGDAQHRAGDSVAHETLEHAAELARSSQARDVLVRAALAANRGFMRIDQQAPGYLAMVEAAVAAADRSDVATYAQLVALLAQSLLYTPDAPRRVQLAHEALELAAGHPDPVLPARIAPAVLNALWAPGDRALRARVAADAVSAAEAAGDPALRFGAHHSAWNVAVESADPVTAARCLAKMRMIVAARPEPRLCWVAGLCDTFEATMAGRLEDAEALAASTLEIGLQIGAPDAFAFYAGEAFVIGTFGGRHAELFPLVEQAARDNPGVLPFELAYGILCQAVGRDDAARRILRAGAAHGFTGLPVDNIWMTTIIGYAVLAIELGDVAAAEQLLPLVAPFRDAVAFNGITSQGPIAAYVGKLASLVGEHDLADDSLAAALTIAESFGWNYHRATTLHALAEARARRLGSLDEVSRAWLAEASDLCRAGGFRSWGLRVDTLAAVR